MNTQLRNLFPLALLAIFVLIVYAAFISRGGQLRDAQQRRDALATTSPPPDVVAAEEARVRQIEKRLAQLKKENAALEVSWSQLNGRISPAPAARARSLRQFSQMLWSNGLYEVERSQTENSESHLPPSLSEMVKNVSGNSGSPTAKVWKVRFYGRYQNVMSMLESLRTASGGGQVSILPIALSMSETKAEAEGWRVWTLLLWM